LGVAWGMLPELPPPPPIEQDPLPYVTRLEHRDPSRIEGIVIHCTETPDLASARNFGERVLYRSGTGNSGHYYIDLDGRILQYVDLDRVAHHVRGYNERTIGIELVNRGRWPRWYDSDHQGMDTPYSEAQIAALTALLAHLEASLPQLAWIAGHEDLDTDEVAANDDPARRIRRKRDPGPQFPWERVLAAIRLSRLGP